MGEPSKPSGIRPPSKIGRPCFGSIPKPSVPQTPKTNGSTSSVRKLTEDLLRTKINEETEDDEPFHGYGRRGSYERKSSIGGASSSDSWSEARRLSEAGVRRTSDNSVILTEDTDSFIVGDKVWVGGTKPGRIAFIGETHFAAGDWAGIVLDEPIGKNNGSVGKVKYFQCEPMKGVFSRLGRLSRYPISVPSPPLAPSPSPPPSVVSSSKRATPPPVPRTPPLTSPPSPAQSTRGEPTVGDRVIVMSGQGSKIGILRFRGETSFAAGVWCGVELDDPVGKNDGSVEGIRYFECMPKYGLFAPAAKVSKSPAPDRRPSCQLHHGVRRASSRESLTSVTSRASTVTSTASRVRLGLNSLKKPMVRPSTTGFGTPKATPQELLKTKQDQIEKLLKERDLDRARMVRAAEQTEEAEKQLNLLRAEFELFRVESKKKTEDLENEIKNVQQEKNDVVAQLEDWKFRAEEESISKSTLEEEQEEQLQCMDAWKKAFAEKEEEVKKLLLQVNELEETRNRVVSLESEVEDIKRKAKDKESELKQELIDTIDRANRMEQNYNDIQNEYETQSSLKEDTAPLKETIAKLETSLSAYEVRQSELEKALQESQEIIQKEKTASQEIKQQLTDMEAKWTEAEDRNKQLEVEKDLKLKDQSAESSSLAAEIGLLKEKLSSIQKKYNEANERNTTLMEELTALESSKASMQKDQDRLQQSIDDWKKTLSEKEIEIRNLSLQVSELNETKLLMSSLKEESEDFRKKANEIENELKKELIETVEKASQIEESLKESQSQARSREEETVREVSSLRDAIKKLEESVVASEQTSNALETRSKELEIKLVDKEKVIENLKKEAHDLQYKLKESETYNKLLGEGEQKLKAQCADMSNLLTQVTQLKDDLGDAQNKYKSALEQSMSLRKELDEIQASSQNKLLDIDRKYNNDIQNLTKKLNEFSSVLSDKEKELSEEKIKTDEHEREFSFLQKELVDLKNSLEVNKNKLDEKEKEISFLKTNLDDTKAQLQITAESLKKSNTEGSLKSDSLLKDLESTKATLSLLESDKNILLSSFQQEKEQLIEKISSLESTIKSLQSNLEMSGKDVNSKDDEIVSLLAKITGLDDSLKKQTDKLQSKTSEVESLNNKLKDISDKYELQLQKEAEIEKLKTSLSSISIEKDTIAEELLKSNKNLEELTSKLLKSESDAAKKEKELTDELSKMRDSFEKVNIELKHLTDTTAKTEGESAKECQDLRTALAEAKKSLVEKDLASAETLKQFEMRNESLLKELNERKDSEKQLEEIIKSLNVQLHSEKTNTKKMLAEIADLKEGNEKRVSLLEAEMKVVASEKELVEGKAKQLASEVSTLRAASTPPQPPGDPDLASWLEEKQLAESEINFLNSIIVDMQKKNDFLTQQMQAIELGETDIDRSGVKKKKKEVTPRMFCDICDVFDAHETEDCPRQASADSPPPIQAHAPQLRGVVRPYCDVCEMFGHSTEDCDDTETF